MRIDMFSDHNAKLDATYHVYYGNKVLVPHVVLFVGEFCEGLILHGARDAPRADELFRIYNPTPVCTL